MKYDPSKHNRQSLRLKHYDYSQAGYYFVTIVTQHRQEIFGEIKQGVMHTNAAGQMVSAQWQALSDRFPQIALDAFVVMPNHVHGVIAIQNETPPHCTPAPTAAAAGAGLVPALNLNPAQSRPKSESRHSCRRACCLWGGWGIHKGYPDG